MKIKAVIFDMDGVICHTNPFHAEAFNHFFDSYGIKPTEEDYKNHMYGKSNAYILSHFLGRKIEGEELKLLEQKKEGLFREIYASQVKPIDGFLEFLKILKSNKVKTGVGTSAPRANLDLIMTSLGFQKDMESLLASENVNKHKPDPEVYLSSAKNMGVEPSECLVFEDSFSGVSAGLNARMQVVGVLSSHTPAELPPCSLYINDYTSLSWPLEL
jgi:beta-phosphoglucomutase